MILNTEIKRSDLVAVQLPLIFKFRGNIYVYLLCIALASMAMWKVLENNLMSFLLLVLVVATVLFMFSFIIGILIQLFVSTTKQGLIGTHSIEITDEGLAKETLATKELVKWGAIKRVILLKKYIYVLMPDYRSHIIPRRSFDSENDFLSFAREITKHVVSA